MAFKFHRGDYLQCVVTGFKGAVTARQDSLTGCNRYCLQPSVDKDGKLPDGYWIDEHSLEYDQERLGQQVKLDRAAEQPPG